MSSLGQSFVLTEHRKALRERSARIRSLYDLNDLLVRTHRRLRDAHEEGVDASMDHLIDGIDDMRANTGNDSWRVAVDKIRRHPVAGLTHQDPFTHRGFYKPRGYPGDGPMLDFIYRDRPGFALPEGVTALGTRIFEYITTTSLARAMLNRRSAIAAQIDHAAERTSDAEILALQCGHLREAELSNALRAGRIRRFIAVDRDIHALATVENEWRRNGVSAINTPTYALLNGASHAMGRFDLIYSAALFDELPVKSAVRAVGAMFAMLKPGGKLWIANLTPALREAAYLEAFMNWWPVYRTSVALEGLLAEVPDREVANRRISFEPNEQVAFLELERRE